MINRTALLFYKDGQVKFTGRVVPVEQYLYREAFTPNSVYHGMPEENTEIYYREFQKKCDIFKYTIYEERG